MYSVIEAGAILRLYEMCLRSGFMRGCQDPALAIKVFMHRDDSKRRDFVVCAFYNFTLFSHFQSKYMIQKCQDLVIAMIV